MPRCAAAVCCQHVTSQIKYMYNAPALCKLYCTYLIRQCSLIRHQQLNLEQRVTTEGCGGKGGGVGAGLLWLALALVTRVVAATGVKVARRAWAWAFARGRARDLCWLASSRVSSSSPASPWCCREPPTCGCAQVTTCTPQRLYTRVLGMHSVLYV